MSGLPSSATHVPHQCAVLGNIWHDRRGPCFCQYCQRPVNAHASGKQVSFSNPYAQQHHQYSHDAACSSNHVHDTQYYQQPASGYERRHWDLPVREAIPRETIGFDHPSPPYEQHEYYTPYPNQPPVTLPSILPMMQYDTPPLENHVQPPPKQSSRGQERRGSKQTGNVKVQCDICKANGKESFFGRDADLTRHIESVHNKDKRYDCDYSPCERRGEKGFTRKDHLKDHVRQVHDKNLPKKRVNRAKRDSDDGM